MWWSFIFAVHSNFTYDFFYLGFFSLIFTIHRTVGEGRSHLFNTSLPLYPALQTLKDISRAITAESLPTHGSRTIAQGKLPSNPNSAHNPKPNPEPKVGAVVRTPPTYSWQLDS